MEGGRIRKYGQKHQQLSPDRAKVWKERSPRYRQREPEPEPEVLEKNQKVVVVYYLCRNRELEHPLASSEGLFLTDVIEKLNGLRGRGMASMYPWSCKRSYKNGFVWHDLFGDDLILPTIHIRWPMPLRHMSVPQHLNKEIRSVDKSSKQQRPVNGTVQGKYNTLRKTQIKIATEAWESASKEYQELLVGMCQQKRAAILSYAKSYSLGWFEPLKTYIGDAIDHEVGSFIITEKIGESVFVLSLLL